MEPVKREVGLSDLVRRSYRSMTLPSATASPAESSPASGPLAWFADMIDHCYEYAERARAEGRPIVGIMCEFTPREIILAAGGVPVCLCGGSAKTVADAEAFLPANLCPLIKSTFGYHLRGTNPFLNWAELVVAETTCDGKKKMFELMGTTKPMYVLELPQKSDDPDGLEHWIRELHKFRDYLEQRFNTRVTDDKLREAIALMNRERGLRRRLAELMTRENPPLTGRQLIEFKSIISGIPADLEQYERALALLDGVTSTGVCPSQERRPPARRSEGPQTDKATQAPAALNAESEAVPSTDNQRHGRVRVLLTGVPLVHGAERVLELIEQAGAVVVAMENCTGLKPILEDVDLTEPDPIRALARKYYHLPCSVLTPNTRRFDTLRTLMAQYRPECVIELVWQACLTYDIESFQVRRLVEEDFGLPYLKITTDYSPSDSARLSTRLEALMETVRSRR